jgi:hypothetical protein
MVSMCVHVTPFTSCPALETKEGPQRQGREKSRKKEQKMAGATDAATGGPSTSPSCAKVSSDRGSTRFFNPQAGSPSRTSVAAQAFLWSLTETHTGTRPEKRKT